MREVSIPLPDLATAFKRYLATMNAISASPPPKPVHLLDGLLAEQLIGHWRHVYGEGGEASTIVNRGIGWVSHPCSVEIDDRSAEIVDCREDYFEIGTGRVNRLPMCVDRREVRMVRTDVNEWIVTSDKRLGPWLGDIPVC